MCTFHVLEQVSVCMFKQTWVCSSKREYVQANVSMFKSTYVCSFERRVHVQCVSVCGYHTSLGIFAMWTRKLKSCSAVGGDVGRVTGVCGVCKSTVVAPRAVRLGNSGKRVASLLNSSSRIWHTVLFCSQLSTQTVPITEFRNTWSTCPVNTQTFRSDGDFSSIHATSKLCCSLGTCLTHFPIQSSWSLTALVPAIATIVPLPQTWEDFCECSMAIQDTWRTCELTSSQEASRVFFFGPLWSDDEISWPRFVNKPAHWKIAQKLFCALYNVLCHQKMRLWIIPPDPWAVGSPKLHDFEKYSPSDAFRNQPHLMPWVLGASGILSERHEMRNVIWANVMLESNVTRSVRYTSVNMWPMFPLLQVELYALVHVCVWIISITR